MSIRGSKADKGASCLGPSHQAKCSPQAQSNLVGTESTVCCSLLARSQHTCPPSVPSKKEQRSRRVRLKMPQSSVRESVSHIKVHLFTARTVYPFLHEEEKKQKRENKKKLSQPATKAARKRPSSREWTHEQRPRRIFELDFLAGGA